VLVEQFNPKAMHPEKEQMLLNYLNPDRRDELGNKAQFKYVYKERTCFLFTVLRRSIGDMNDFKRLVDDQICDSAEKDIKNKKRKAVNDILETDNNKQQKERSVNNIATSF